MKSQNRTNRKKSSQLNLHSGIDKYPVSESEKTPYTFILLLNQAYNVSFDFREVYSTYQMIDNSLKKEEYLSDRLGVCDQAYICFCESLFDYLLDEYREDTLSLYVHELYNKGFPNIDLQRLYEKDFYSKLRDEDARSLEIIKTDNVMNYHSQKEQLYDLKSAVVKYNQYKENESYANFHNLGFKIGSIREFCKLMGNPQTEILYLEYIVESFMKNGNGKRDMKGKKTNNLPLADYEFINEIKKEILVREALKRKSTCKSDDSKVFRMDSNIASTQTIWSKENLMTEPTVSSVRTPIQWLSDTESLNCLFDILNRNHFVSDKTIQNLNLIIEECFTIENSSNLKALTTTKSARKKHLERTKVPENKIEWLEGTTAILRLIDILYNRRVIPQKTYDFKKSVIRSCFTLESGKEINDKTIHALNSNKPNKCRMQTYLEQIIDEALKIKSKASEEL